MAENAASILSLPVEMVYEIFSHLRRQDLYCLRDAYKNNESIQKLVDNFVTDKCPDIVNAVRIQGSRTQMPMSKVVYSVWMELKEGYKEVVLCNKINSGLYHGRKIEFGFPKDKAYICHIMTTNVIRVTIFCEDPLATLKMVLMKLIDQSYIPSFAIEHAVLHEELCQVVIEWVVHLKPIVLTFSLDTLKYHVEETSFNNMLSYFQPSALFFRDPVLPNNTQISSILSPAFFKNREIRKCSVVHLTDVRNLKVTYQLHGVRDYFLTGEWQNFHVSYELDLTASDILDLLKKWNDGNKAIDNVRICLFTAGIGLTLINELSELFDKKEIHCDKTVTSLPPGVFRLLNKDNNQLYIRITMFTFSANAEKAYFR